MKAKLTGQNNRQAGFSTLEMLIALAVIVTVISSVILVVFGNQSVSADTVTNNEALTKTQALLEQARAQSLLDYASVMTTSPVSDGIYTKQTTVDPLSVTPCGKDVESTVLWARDHNRSLSIKLRTHLTDFVTALSTSHCSGTPPAPGWNPPVTYNCANFNPGKPRALDVLNRVVYMVSDKTPYLYINDTNGAVLNSGCQATQSPPFITFANGFNDGATLINDIKVARLPDGKVYAMVARDTGTNANQFEIINVNDIYNPDPGYPAASSRVFRTLAGVSGSEPEGWRLYYYNNKVYIVTKFTAGPELHIFDVSTPTNPVEIKINGILGKDLGRTVESMTVTKKNISGVDHYFLLTAADKDSAEVSVFDITYSSPTVATLSEVIAPDQDLPGIQDGASVFYSNGYLYFGRNSTPSGSDFYIFDAHTPQSGLTKKQEQDIGSGVLGIAAAGPFSFLATTKSNAEFQVWTSDPAQTITKVNTVPFNFPNLISNGVVYEYPYVYVASQGNDALRILYSP